MILHEAYFSKELFIAALSFALVAMLYAFGKEIIADIRKAEKASESSLSSREVSRYFLEKGYIVCSITKVKGTDKWLAFLIRNGEYEVATVFTNGDSIEGHQHSLAF